MCKMEIITGPVSESGCSCDLGSHHLHLTETAPTTFPSLKGTWRQILSEFPVFLEEGRKLGEQARGEQMVARDDIFKNSIKISCWWS